MNFLFWISVALYLCSVLGLLYGLRRFFPKKLDKNELKSFFLALLAFFLTLLITSYKIETIESDLSDIKISINNLFLEKKMNEYRLSNDIMDTIITSLSMQHVAKYLKSLESKRIEMTELRANIFIDDVLNTIPDDNFPQVEFFSMLADMNRMSDPIIRPDCYGTKLEDMRDSFAKINFIYIFSDSIVWNNFKDSSKTNFLTYSWLKRHNLIRILEFETIKNLKCTVSYKKIKAHESLSDFNLIVITLQNKILLAANKLSSSVVRIEIGETDLAKKWLQQFEKKNEESKSLTIDNAFPNFPKSNSGI